MARYSLRISRNFEKDLKSLPKKDVLRLLQVVRGLAENPRPLGSIKLKGSDHFRIRVGVYRIIYIIQDSELIVLVLGVGHRKDVYR